ncbi:hypothetical protein ACFX2A_027851 [Malus domestica]
MSHSFKRTSTLSPIPKKLKYPSSYSSHSLIATPQLQLVRYIHYKGIGEDKETPLRRKRRVAIPTPPTFNVLAPASVTDEPPLRYHCIHLQCCPDHRS